MKADRNAITPARIRRLSQQLRTDSLFDSLVMTSPLLKSGSTVTLTLLATGGLQVTSSSLGIKLDTTPALVLGAGGLKVLLDSAGALSSSASGLAAVTDNVTLNIVANKLAVKAAGIGSTQLGLLTTKGDLLGFTTVHARVPVGATNGGVLFQDSSAAAGVTWSANIVATASGVSVGNSAITNYAGSFQNTSTGGLRCASSGTGGAGMSICRTTNPASGQTVGNILFNSEAAGGSIGAVITVNSTENWSSGHAGCYQRFDTTATGSSSRREVLRLDQNGDVLAQVGDVKAVAGNLVVVTAGKGLNVKEGTDARMGVVQLSLGTVVVSTTAVTANSRIMLTGQDAGTGGIGEVYVSARTGGVSFTITSTDATDDRNIAWVILEPA